MSEKLIRVDIDLNQNDVIVIPKNRKVAPILFFDNEKSLAIESIDYNYFTSNGFEGGKHKLKLTIGDTEKEVFEYKGFKLFSN